MSAPVLQTFNNYFSANIILSRLQDEGIRCWLLNENTGTIYPVLGNAIGGIRLAVAEQDAARAAELLKSYHDEYVQSAVCPRCGRHEIEETAAKTPRNILTVILSWIISGYGVSADNIYRCWHCGYESKTLPEADSAAIQS